MTPCIPIYITLLLGISFQELVWSDNETDSMKSRGSRPEVFCKKGVLENLAKFRGKHLCQSFFFKKVPSLKPAALLKRDSSTGVFL